jgi:transposase
MADASKTVKRSRFSNSDKRRIVMESEAADVSVSDVARRNGVSDSRVWEWRRQKRLGQLDGAGGPVFIPVQITDDPASATSDIDAEDDLIEAPRAHGFGRMEIDLGGNHCIRVDREVDTAALRRVLDALGVR